MNTQDRLQGIGAWAHSRTGLVTIALLAIVGFFLVVEHYAHIFGLLPFALLLLCPLMMLFMHGGHGSHDHNNGQPNDDKPHVHGGEE